MPVEIHEAEVRPAIVGVELQRPPVGGETFPAERNFVAVSRRGRGPGITIPEPQVIIRLVRSQGRGLLQEPDRHRVIPAGDRDFPQVIDGPGVTGIGRGELLENVLGLGVTPALVERLPLGRD